MEKILVIDDDPAVQRVLLRTFATNGFDVSVVGDGGLAMEVLRSTRPDVVILDLFLPRKSGWELCCEIKQESATLPIIVLSAACEVVEKVLLLELGAQDYVTKPFSPRELLARVRVALRRLRESSKKSDLFTFGDIEVDFSTMELRRAEKNVALTPQEFKLLRFFLTNKERVVSRSQLLDQVWGYNCFPTTRTVDMHVLHLRQKLENDPSEPAHIQTVHGVGYRFVC